jgi:hypothetical protein
MEETRKEEDRAVAFGVCNGQVFFTESLDEEALPYASEIAQTLVELTLSALRSILRIRRIN